MYKLTDFVALQNILFWLCVENNKKFIDYQISVKNKLFTYCDAKHMAIIKFHGAV